MSRIGKLPISIPDTVKVELQDHTVSVNGPKGTLSMVAHPAMDVRVQDRQVLCGRPSDAKFHKALHGLTRSLIANMVEGVTKGFTKELEIQGVGFKGAVQGRKAVFTLGYSSPVEMDIPAGIEIKVTENVNIVVSGPDKQCVGDFAARIRSFYPAEPYKGKGIRYKGEYIKRKVGKTVA